MRGVSSHGGMPPLKRCPRCGAFPAHKGECHGPLANKPQKEDPINPDYYKQGGIEAADIGDAYDLSRWEMNILKYLLRKEKKSGAARLQDLRKLVWYAERQIKLEGQR